jgi:hypothetical protein
LTTAEDGVAVLHGGRNPALNSRRSGVGERTMVGCVSRTTPVEMWCCELV